MPQVNTLAEEIRTAYAARQTMPPPSSRDAAFDLDVGYSIEAELRRLRRSEGRRVVGLKIGYANRAVWRTLKLDTLIWAAMYDNTVRYASDGKASFDLGRAIAPKLEPEVVVKLSRPIAPSTDPAAVLASVEWLALGFEIVDCVYPEWKFQPADFVAAYGLHIGLIVGAPHRVTADRLPQVVDELAQFKARLTRDGQLVEEGGGANVLKSPALCLGELGSAIAKRPGAEPLEAGYVITTGALIVAQPCAAGQEWRVDAEGIDLEPVSVRFSG